MKVGAPVEARWRGLSMWFKGTVKAVNADGSFEIDYNDVGSLSSNC